MSKFYLAYSTHSLHNWPSATWVCQQFALYIAVNDFFSAVSLLAWNFLYGLQSRTVKQYCVLSSNLKHEAKSMISFFFQSIQFSVIFRQHKKKNRTSSELGSYFLLNNFSRLNFALRATFNQHLYCLALHCECLIIWLTNPIFSFPVQHWNEGHLLKWGKVSPLKGPVQ